MPVLCAELPWRPGALKNRRWRPGRRGLHLDPDAAMWHAEAIWRLRAAWGPAPFGPVAPAKLWVGLAVRLPHRRSDALNVLDAVADAVQAATGVNDRAYAVACLDWAVDRTRPPAIFVACSAAAAPARRAATRWLVAANAKGCGSSAHAPSAVGAGPGPVARGRVGRG